MKSVPISDTNQAIAPRRLEYEIDNSPIRVSYIIITLNRSEHLKRALGNVREFIDEQDELIVVDGGSVDRTADVIQENRDIVSVFVSERDTSEAHASNKGLCLARGRFIKFITDDDYFYPAAMRCLVAVAEMFPEVDAIQAGGEIWSADDDQLKFDGFFRFIGDEENPSELDIFHCHIGLGLLMRRRAALKIGGGSPGYASPDGDCHCKLVEANLDIRYLDINLFRWYSHPHSGSRNKEKMALSHMLFALRLRMWERFNNRPRQDFATRLSALDATPEGAGLQYGIYLIWRYFKAYMQPFKRRFGELFNAEPKLRKLKLATAQRCNLPFTGKLLPRSKIDDVSERSLLVLTGRLVRDCQMAQEFPASG